jgi:gamma-tubulin complex component 4
MLHELLLALVGCTGDVFMDVKEQAQALGLTSSAQALGLTSSKDGKGQSEVVDDVECTFRLAPDITFLQESET